jgi:hypothetical protein
MGILFFIAFVVLAYFYMTELIIPWYSRKSLINKAVKESAKFKDAPVNLLWNPPPTKVTLPMGTIMATTVVNIMKPVLLVSKQDDIRIYYPDNSVDYLSVLTEKWEKVQTSYRSVYEYATKTDCIIVENL